MIGEVQSLQIVRNKVGSKLTADSAGLHIEQRDHSTKYRLNFVLRHDLVGQQLPGFASQAVIVRVVHRQNASRTF
jgi:hypothetical protein